MRRRVLQVLSEKSRDSFTFFGQTCTYAYHVHYANGEIRFARSDYSCTP
jgi:hypothetical protein